ncbi:hypothetical protein B0H19DRAFT_1085073 [Mycena capillaripes]|nr:hypothetical protein B0H19DRAFT_1085073 [Mycena capillaripes]
MQTCLMRKRRKLRRPKDDRTPTSRRSAEPSGHTTPDVLLMRTALTVIQYITGTMTALIGITGTMMVYDVILGHYWVPTVCQPQDFLRTRNRMPPKQFMPAIFSTRLDDLFRASRDYYVAPPLQPIDAEPSVLGRAPSRRHDPLRPDEGSRAPKKTRGRPKSYALDLATFHDLIPSYLSSRLLAMTLRQSKIFLTCTPTRKMDRYGAVESATYTLDSTARRHLIRLLGRSRKRPQNGQNTVGSMYGFAGTYPDGSRVLPQLKYAKIIRRWVCFSSEDSDTSALSQKASDSVNPAQMKEVLILFLYGAIQVPLSALRNVTVLTHPYTQRRAFVLNSTAGTSTPSGAAGVLRRR